MEIKARLTKVKDHVVDNRAKYTGLAVTVMFMALNVRNARNLDAFFKDNGLDPRDYWTPDWKS